MTAQPMLLDAPLAPAVRILWLLFGRPEEIDGAGRCPTYLYRWHLAHVGPVKIYLHRFVGEDWSLDLHDHHWKAYVKTPIGDARVACR